jgi:hypothetical protein
MTGTPKAIDWDAQRRILTDARDEALAELKELADRRRSLSLDVQLGVGTAKQADLDLVVERMTKRTADADRARESLTELDRRQAASEAAAAAAARRKLEGEVQGRLQRLGALGSSMADHLVELRRLLVDVAVLEREVAQLAGRLDLQLPRGASRKNVLARALVGLQVQLPSYFISPDEGLAAEERLRDTPTLSPTFGHAAPVEPRPAVPFANDPEPQPVASPSELANRRLDEEMRADEALSSGVLPS